MKRANLTTFLLIAATSLLAVPAFANGEAELQECKGCEITLKQNDGNFKLSKKKVNLEMHVSPSQAGFKNALDVKYCNINADKLKDIRVEVSFDKYLQLVGANIPMKFNQDEPDEFQFVINELKGNDCGQFQIYVNPNVIGQSEHTSTVGVGIEFENHNGKTVHRGTEVSMLIAPVEEEDIKGQTHIIEDDILLEQEDVADSDAIDLDKDAGKDTEVLASTEPLPTYHSENSIHSGFSAKDAKGTTEESAELAENPVEGIFIPNAFTPNNDGHNDQFMAVGNSMLNVKEFLVFNRWGELVHSNPSNGWDGTFNGVFMSPGIYMYRMVIELEGKSKVYTGNVSLLR